MNDIFEEYLREKEPQKKAKGYAWHTAIGLQAVDGLSTSDYLIETAKKNIDGDITFEEANNLIYNYYKEIFAENAWYFRNALVRANYTNLKKGVHETTEYLELFLRNLLLGENNLLQNRNMHISGILEVPKCQEEISNGTLDVTLDEMQVLNLLKKDGKLTQKKLGELIGKSDRTAKRITVSLEKKKYIERINGKRFGYWKVNVK